MLLTNAPITVHNTPSLLTQALCTCADVGRISESRECLCDKLDNRSNERYLPDNDDREMSRGKTSLDLGVGLVTGDSFDLRHIYRQWETNK